MEQKVFVKQNDYRYRLANGKYQFIPIVRDTNSANDQSDWTLRVFRDIFSFVCHSLNQSRLTGGPCPYFPDR